MLQGVNGRRRRWIALCLAFVCMPPAFATTPAVPQPAEAPPLILGILPFMSPIALFKRFAPLRDYLSEATGRQVLLETARDYPEYVRRTAQRRYDIVLTAPHFVLPALRDGLYQLQATDIERLAAVVLVPSASTIRDPAQLAGLRVATPPSQAIVTWLGTELIRQATGGNHPGFHAYSSHNAAYRAVGAGEVDAAMVVTSIVDPARLAHDGLREIARSESFPAMGILMASDLPPAVREQLTGLLIGMTENAAGRATLQRIDWSGYRRVASRDFESMRVYTKPVAQLPEARP